MGTMRERESRPSFNFLIMNYEGYKVKKISRNQVVLSKSTWIRDGTRKMMRTIGNATIIHDTSPLLPPSIAHSLCGSVI